MAEGAAPPAPCIRPECQYQTYLKVPGWAFLAGQKPDGYAYIYYLGYAAATLNILSARVSAVASVVVCCHRYRIQGQDRKAVQPLRSTT